MMQIKPIYLDYNATTPVDPEVAAVMQHFLSDSFGNPSSSHYYGFEARRIVESARLQVASLLNCNPEEIVFTSGGTESNNYAIKGIACIFRNQGNHIITSVIEHPAVLEVCAYLENKGFRITYLPVSASGIIDIRILEEAITRDTILITIMHANNETGTIQPVREIADIARKRNIIFHTDAAQSVGKIKTDVRYMGVDLLSLAGHKFYGPKGIGALYIRSGVTLEKFIHGADHEKNRRAGTENVMEIAGLGKACEIAERDLEQNYTTLKKTRDLLYQKIKDSLPSVVRNGDPNQCLPNTLSLSFPGITSDLLLSSLPGIAASAGAACHSDKQTTSHVLEAMGIPNEQAAGTIRFSTGKFTTSEEIEKSAAMIIESVSEFLAVSTAGNNYTKHTSVKLTQYTHGLGCACKLGPGYIEKILRKMPPLNDPRVIIDARNADDATVYKLTEDIAVIQTVDFFTPVVDDPYDFGAIATSNALSDIYAMGGKPLYALNIVGFPAQRLPYEVLESILDGARSVALEADIYILGGHTIENSEPIFGMTVTGIAHPGKILSNCRAQKGDILILTKPLGTGIISTGIKKGQANEQIVQNTIMIMKQLNKTAAEIAGNYPVNACTDITGFGFLGHLLEIVKASKVSAEVFPDQIPFIPGTIEFFNMGLIPGGTKNNKMFYDPWITWNDTMPESCRMILCDAQTSGGLLFSIPEKSGMDFLSDLREHGINHANIVGRIIHDPANRIYFVEK